MKKILFLFAIPAIALAMTACAESPAGIERDSSSLTAAKGKGAATIIVGDDVTVWDSSLSADPVAGILPIEGSGQINGEFTIAQRDGIQIALRAQQRFTGPLEASGKKIGRYSALRGGTTTEDNLAEWNYDWHVDLRDSGTTLADYDLTLQVSNIANELFGFPTPVDLTFGGAIPGNTVLYQQSWNPGFGNDSFDPDKRGTYNLRLRLSPKDGGAPLSVKIQVRVR